jgi:hypothetical protein
LARSGIVPLCKENVGMVGAEKHKKADYDYPINVPHGPHFEIFLALLAHALYAIGWKAKNEAELFGGIKRKLTEIDVSVVQKLTMLTTNR